MKRLGSTWHVGETYDVSVDGMRIVMPSVTGIDVMSRLDILCFPRQGSLTSYILEPEPVTMAGAVVWLDEQTRSLGVRLDS